MERYCQEGPERLEHQVEWATDRERWKGTVRRDLKSCNIREEWATDRERWKGTVRGDLKAYNIREEWATDRERCNARNTAQGDGGER